jgi:formamidopyrimidine-DNA glycosylase
MPELPDVEGFRRYLTRYAAGKEVRRVEVGSADMLRNTTRQGLGRALKGHRLGRPRRHGKWLAVPAGRRDLVLHFGMTGGLVWNGEPHRHDRVTLHFADGHLAYRNMRKLGGVWLSRGEAEQRRIMGSPGPDAATLDRSDFAELMAGRRGGVKATLMNQRILAGIGNELSDEILWRARIDPSRRLSELDRRRVDRLHRAMRTVLRRSMRRGRIPRDRGWLTSQRGRRHPMCPRCGGRLRRSQVAGRTAYWCGRCQR